jgi:hypothetical protein
MHLRAVGAGKGRGGGGGGGGGGVQRAAAAARGAEARGASHVRAPGASGSRPPPPPARPLTDKELHLPNAWFRRRRRVGGAALRRRRVAAVGEGVEIKAEPVAARGGRRGGVAPDDARDRGVAADGAVVVGVGAVLRRQLAGDVALGEHLGRAAARRGRRGVGGCGEGRGRAGGGQGRARVRGARAGGARGRRDWAAISRGARRCAGQRAAPAADSWRRAALRHGRRAGVRPRAPALPRAPAGACGAEGLPRHRVAHLSPAEARARRGSPRPSGPADSP